MFSRRASPYPGLMITQPFLAGPRPRQATARTYLMCPPEHFAVEYVINPWMDPDRPVDVELALRQWEELKRTYERLGHSVSVVPAQPGLPDMVFAANSGTVIGGRVLGSRFRAEQRAAEAEHFRRWFAGNGYREIVMPSRINEAEGDFAWTGQFLLAGTGFRTDPAAHGEAQEVLGVPVVSLRLVDPRYYHLDTALAVLSETEVMYYPEAFSERSRAVLRLLYPEAVLATAEDAAVFGLNAVSDGRRVVLPEAAVALAERLRARGFEPIGIDVTELRKGGGSVKCCTLELRAG